MTYIVPENGLSWKLLKDIAASPANRLQTGTEEEVARAGGRVAGRAALPDRRRKLEQPA